MSPLGRSHHRVEKLIGFDAELGNFVRGLHPAPPGGTGGIAARALLAEIDGFPEGSPPMAESVVASGERWAAADRGAANGVSVARAGGGVVAACDGLLEGSDGPPMGGGWNARDWGRKFLASNGGCVYIDLDHLELCTPEVRSAADHVAAWHAMLRIARRAQVAANRRRSPAEPLEVLVNNSDGLGNAYGSHVSVLMSRDAWSDMFHRKLHHLLYLASFQVSSIVYTGQGKVGSENRRPRVDFQLSQRADFFEQLSSHETTHERPIVNSRDEPLCETWGRRDLGLARQHVIFFDNTLAQVATYLKVGVTQIILAMIEAGQVKTRWIIEDPVAASIRWSHDSTLSAKARLYEGRFVTAVELQMRFLEEATRFAARGGLEEWVPGAGDILALWGDTLEKLARRDFGALAPRLDWVLKRVLLEQVIAEESCGWDSPRIKQLDHFYSSLDPAEGLYFSCERAGAMESVVSERAIERFVHEPPTDSRAFGRVMLMRRAGREAVRQVNWNTLRIELDRPGRWPEVRTISMADPRGFTRRDLASARFQEDASLEEVLNALDSSRETTALGNP